MEALVGEALPSASIVDFFSQGFDLLWAQPAVADVRDGGGGLQRFEVAVVPSAVLVVAAVGLWRLNAAVLDTCNSSTTSIDALECM